MPDTPSIREDLTTLSTEALAKRAHQIATGPYNADTRVMAYLSETLRRVAALEMAAPSSRQDRMIERHRREIAAENASN